MSDGGILSNIPEGFEARMQRRAALTTADLNHIIETLPAQVGQTTAQTTAEHEARFRGQETMGVSEARIGRYKEQVAAAASEVVLRALKQWPLPETRGELAHRLKSQDIARDFSVALKTRGVPEAHHPLICNEFTEALASDAKAIEMGALSKAGAVGGLG